MVQSTNKHKIVVHSVYKLLEGEDMELEKEYSYWMCIAFQKNYFILNELEYWANTNSMGADFETIEDIDERYIDSEELNINHLKKLNRIEALYYVNEDVEHVKPENTRKKFNLV